MSKKPTVKGETVRISGRQLTTIFVAFMAAVVLYPIGAKAAGNLVTLVDSTTSNKARVIADGRLAVVDRPAGTTLWSYTKFASGHLFEPPLGKTTLAITSLTATNQGTGFNTVGIRRYLTNDCSGSYQTMEWIVVPARQTVHTTFPTPLVITGPSNSNWCVEVAENADDSFMSVTGVGYYS